MRRMISFTSMLLALAMVLGCTINIGNDKPENETEEQPIFSLSKEDIVKFRMGKMDFENETSSTIVHFEIEPTDRQIDTIIKLYNSIEPNRIESVDKGDSGIKIGLSIELKDRRNIRIHYTHKEELFLTILTPTVNHYKLDYPEFKSVFEELLQVYVNASQKEAEDIDLQAVFSKWDNEEITDSEKTRIMGSFVEYLNHDPDISNEEISVLSDLFSILETDHFRIVQYIENVEVYGSSGRESYHIILYDGLVEMIGQKGSMRIDEVIELDEHRLYVFATDYKVSNVTGVQIFNVAIDGTKVNVTPAIHQSTLANQFIYDEMDDVLYYDNGHIYFNEIKKDGTEVLIKAGDEIYVLQLDINGQYFLVN